MCKVQSLKIYKQFTYTEILRFVPNCQITVPYNICSFSINHTDLLSYFYCSFSPTFPAKPMLFSFVVILHLYFMCVSVKALMPFCGTNIFHFGMLIHVLLLLPHSCLQKNRASPPSCPLPFTKHRQQQCILYSQSLYTHTHTLVPLHPPLDFCS